MSFDWATFWFGREDDQSFGKLRMESIAAALEAAGDNLGEDVGSELIGAALLGLMAGGEGEEGIAEAGAGGDEGAELGELL